MKTKIKTLMTFIICTLVLGALWSVSASAEGEDKQVYSQQFKNNTFYYTVDGGVATITDADASGYVVVPSTLGGHPVKKIGREAFEWQEGITSLIIQNGIEEIGDYAFSFYNDEYWDEDPPYMHLKDLFLPESVKSIGRYAFRYADLNGDLNLPVGLEAIGEYAFSGMYVEGDINIPEGVKHIGNGAFSSTDFYGNINFPESLETIGENAFYYSALCKIVNIPSKVNTIGNKAFAETSVIGFTANEKNEYFSSDESGVLYNKDKTQILFYPSLKDGETFTIPDTVKTVSANCFYKSRYLKEIIIPESVTKIEGGAFYNCNVLRKLVIPLSVKEIGNYAVSVDSAYYALAHEVYYEGTKEQWDSIGVKLDEKFSVHFSYGTTTHEYTQAITKAPTCKQMGTKTYTCTCGVAYSEDIDRLNEDHSKYYTERITEPGGLQKYGQKETICEKCGMVVDSGRFAAVTSITFSESNYYTGKDIKPAVKVYASGNVSEENYDVIYPEKSTDIGTYKLTVVFKNRYEGTHEFEYKILPSLVKNIKKQLSVKGITFTWDENKEATGYKIGVSVNGNEMKYYDAPADTLTWFVPSVYDGGELEIDKYCIFTVAAVTKLSDGSVMEGNSSRLDVKFTPEQKTYKAKEGTYTYFILGDEATIVKADIKGNVTLPSKLGGKKVTGILSYAFDGLSKLTAVVIPEGVKSIGKGAFRNSGITKLTLPSTLTDLEENAFYYCKKLKTVVLSGKNPALTLDEQGVLYNKDKTELIIFPAKSSVTEYTLPETVKKIWSYAFAYNSTLKSVTVNEGVTEIGEYAFHCCKGMTSLSLPQSLETIGASAFRACTKIESVVVGEKVKRLPTYTFAYCTRLKNVTLPKGLETISSKVFYQCYAIEEIVIPNVRSIGYDAFWDLKSLKALYFMGGKDEWQAATKKYDIGLNNELRVHYSYEDFVHEFKVTPSTEPTCTSIGHGLYECPCGLSYYSSIPAKGHTYTTVYPSKATTERDGLAVSKCDICSYSQATEIYKIEAEFSQCLAYTGQVNIPTVTLKSGKTVLTEGTDYIITYETPDSTDYGEYTFSVRSLENDAFEFDATYTYKILPGETSEIKLTHTTSSIKLSWNEVYGATGYRVYRYDYSEKEWVRIKSTTATSYTVKGLTSGTRYRFAVQAYHKTEDGTVYFSNIKKAVTTSTKPASVKNLYGSSPSKGKLTLSWANVSGESGFEIYYSTSKNGTYKKLSEVKANTVKYTASNLKGGRTLYFKVRAYRTIGDSTVYGTFSNVRAVWVR
ncbi:MAG: leucine-rich repeat protein [Clostridia bacterium]|nr:leucine-rich repeat protein [Clostridia bacterium]